MSSPHTGRLHTEGHLPTTCQSLGHKVPEPVFLCVHGPASACLDPATFRTHKRVFCQDSRTMSSSRMSCVLVQKCEDYLPAPTGLSALRGGCWLLRCGYNSVY